MSPTGECNLSFLKNTPVSANYFSIIINIYNKITSQVLLWMLAFYNFHLQVSRYPNKRFDWVLPNSIVYRPIKSDNSVSVYSKLHRINYFWTELNNFCTAFTKTAQLSANQNRVVLLCMILRI